MEIVGRALPAKKKIETCPRRAVGMAPGTRQGKLRGTRAMIEGNLLNLLIFIPVIGAVLCLIAPDKRLEMPA